MQSPLAAFRAWVQSVRPGRARLTWGDTLAAGSEASDIDGLQAGLELATQGILVLDAGWRIVAFNSTARVMMHSPGAGLAGTEFWNSLAEDVADTQRGAAEQTLQEGATHVFVVHDPFEDRWIEYSLRRHDSGVVVNLRDISDTRQALLLLQGSEFCNQSLFEGNTQAMWLFDAESRRVLALNKEAALFYGVPGDSVAHLHAEAFFPAGEAAAWLDRLPAGDFQQQMQVCAQRRRNGEQVLVELACSKVIWLERPAVLVSVVDVGARHFADQQLQLLNETLAQRLADQAAELQRSRQEIATFTHAMSDDLKAPLHAVSGFASTLAERYSAALDEQGRHYLSRIRASARQLAQLFDDLRTLAHLPGLALSPEPVDLAPLCRRLIDDWCQREPQRQMVLEIPPVLLVYGDRPLLTLALKCLLDNAWKFTARREQGWVQVALLPGASPGGSVLAVSDNGVGFDAAYADKLFTAFQRLHSSADFPGGGLGLAIVKGVAERHGGEVWATSSDQAGASFFMAFPPPAAAPEAPPV